MNFNTKKISGFNALIHDIKALSTDERTLAAFVRDSKDVKDIVSGVLPHTSEVNQAKDKIDVGAWLRDNWPLLRDREKLTSAAENLREATSALARACQEPPAESLGVPLSRWVKNFVFWADSYTEALNWFLSQAEPENIRYLGVTVENPQRFTTQRLAPFLAAFDYVAEIFNRRGVKDVFQDSVHAVQVRNHIPALDGTGAAFYRKEEKKIVMTDRVLDVKFRIDMNAVAEALIHEIGHHVHMNLLDREAAEFWDSGWSEVRKVDEDTKRVTPDERKRFWRMLLDSKGDLRKVRLSGMDRVHFHAWLYRPYIGSGLVDMSRLQWSRDGKNDVAKFLVDDYGFMAARYPDYSDQEVREEVEKKYGLLKKRLGADDNSLVWPILTDAELMKYKGFEGGKSQEVKSLIDLLESPTDYAKMNEKEDFAETFLWFVWSPHKLSKTALYRMQKTLHMSGLYGKPVMKTVASWRRVSARSLRRAAHVLSRS